MRTRTRLLAAATIAVAAISGLHASASADRGGRAYTGLSASWTGLSGSAGTVASVSGRVTGPRSAHRAVGVYVGLPTGWRLLARASTGATGSYRMTFPNAWYRSRAVVVSAPATAAADSARSAAVVNRVTPGYTPLGRRDDFRAMGGARPDLYRWDACRVVTWRLDDPAGTHLADAREGLRRTGQATGIAFRYLGTTRHDPAVDAGWPTDTSLIVGFGRDAQTRWDMSMSAGEGGPRQVRWSLDAADEPLTEIRRAGLWVNTTYVTDHGFGRGDVLGAILLHELGHTVGLLHASALPQMMAPDYDPTLLDRWGAGDLTALGILGAGGGCVIQRPGPPTEGWVMGVDSPATGGKLAPALRNHERDRIVSRPARDRAR